MSEANFIKLHGRDDSVLDKEIFININDISAVVSSKDHSNVFVKGLTCCFEVKESYEQIFALMK